MIKFLVVSLKFKYKDKESSLINHNLKWMPKEQKTKDHLIVFNNFLRMMMGKKPKNPFIKNFYFEKLTHVLPSD